MRSVTQTIFSFIPNNVLLLFCFSSAFSSYCLFFFFPFFFAWSKCEANVALLTKKPHFLICARGAILLSPWLQAIQTFTHELCSFKSIRQIAFLCLLSAGQAATFHQHAAERRLLLGKHSCSCAPQWEIGWALADFSTMWHKLRWWAPEDCGSLILISSGHM